MLESDNRKAFEEYQRLMSRTSYPDAGTEEWEKELRKAEELRQGIAKSLKTPSEYPGNIEPDTIISGLKSVAS